MIDQMNNSEELPLISVIVPVYNQAKYLDCCVQSLLAQTYPCIEIILVDDGSTDGSADLCDAYGDRYRSVTTVHKANGGSSSARNIGLLTARGEWIGFVDSDDWVAEVMFQRLYELALMNETNASQIECIQVREDGATAVQEGSPSGKVESYQGVDVLRRYLDESTRTGSYSACRCLFRTECVRRIKFREGRLNEDIDWKYLALRSCGSLACSNEGLYFYRQTGESNSTGGLRAKDFDLYEAADVLCSLTAEERDTYLAALASVKRARTPLSLLCKIAYYGIEDESLNRSKVSAELKRQLRRGLWTLLDSPIPSSRKILAISFSVSVSLTNMLVSAAKKVGLH